MNKNQKMLVYLLNCAIHKGASLDINYKDINWNYIVDESHAHSVYSLLYPVLKNITSPKFISHEIKEKWKATTLSTAIYLNRQISQLEKVFRRFNEEAIEVIGLKGLFLRDYYPYPDLRTMGDADILVYKEDIEKVRTLLTGLGYVQTDEDTPAHITFVHKQYCPIEVHWKLTDNRYLNNTSKFETEAWLAADTKKFGQAEILCLCIEDFLTHLCLHMAVHMRSGGFGLRQLCDLTLLVENKALDIDWMSFHSKTKENGIEKFAIAIFNVCNIMFSLDIPTELKNTIVDKKSINMLIEDIFGSGVFGQKSLGRIFGNNLLNATLVFKCESSSRMTSVMNLIFPPIDTLSDEYSYAKRYKILTPAAWVHHLLAGIFNKEYNILNKLNFLLFSSLTFKKRNELLKNLEL